MYQLSVAIADSSAQHNAFVVWRGFRESIEKAAKFGYNAVELALCRAEEVDEGMLESALGRHNIDVSAISTGQVFAKLGQYLTHPDKTKRLESVETVRDLIRLSEKYGKIVNLGRTRGFVGEGQSYEEAEALALDSISRLLDTAEACDAELIIEPLNRYETNFINTLDECAEFIQKTGSVRVGMMPDVFHMNIEAPRIGDALVKHQKLVKYIHLADSNRRAPGWGHLDFQDVFDALGRMQFSGWLSVEVFPLPDADSAAKQAIEYLKPLLAQG